MTLDNQIPKIESGADNKEYVLGGIGSFNAPVVAGPPRPMTQILRPPTQITPDLRIIGQPSIRAPIQHIQLHPTTLGQPQKPRVVNNVPKTQRLCKSDSKEGSESSSHSVDPPCQGDTLEVYDLPNTMMRSEVEVILCNLVNAGAQIQYISSDPMTTANSPVSSFHRILAVFPNVNCASQIYQEHCSNSPSSTLFKLRYPSDSS
ncbi:hypothetical protein FSP39_008530 [Pinctada imbricata]|uniref:Uncharacterized protein n=1 Tax=Pinctada imbricata TaxID=66713 RepID=A0AA88YQR5_PINIB|nr:hypothetical protein FSP39_008530 [Pinctada imbricata]